MRDSLLDAMRLDDAVNRGALHEVQELLDEGIDPNIKDAGGDPVLIGAAWVGAPEIVQLLLDRGADVNGVGADGRNALQRVLMNDAYWHHGHDVVVDILRSAGSIER